MPRAEIPESVERFGVEGGQIVELSTGCFIHTSQLPKLHAHWLEQLKEELLSDEVVEAITRRRTSGRKRGMVWEGIKDAARGDLEAALASIPIEEGA